MYNITIPIHKATVNVENTQAAYNTLIKYVADNIHVIVQNLRIDSYVCKDTQDVVIKSYGNLVIRYNPTYADKVIIEPLYNTLIDNIITMLYFLLRSVDRTNLPPINVQYV